MEMVIRVFYTKYREHAYHMMVYKCSISKLVMRIHDIPKYICVGIFCNGIFLDWLLDIKIYRKRNGLHNMNTWGLFN